MRKALIGVVAAVLAAMPLAAQETGEDRTTALPGWGVTAARAEVHPAWRDYRATFDAVACPFEEAHDPDIVRCGTVLVPEDRRDPDSRLIRLMVMRVAPMDDAPEGRAIVRLTGGPGAPAVVGQRASYFSGPAGEALRAMGEIVYFDQRGVGHSERRFCRGIRQFFQHGAVPSPVGQKRTEEALRKCFDEAQAEGIAVHAYDNWSNALDVRDIRRALGYDQWNLLGVSYGTQLAQGVLAVDPEGVRAAVLDSVVANHGGPRLTGSTGRNLERSLGRIEAWCDADVDCAAVYPGLAERFYTAIEGFAETPLRIDGLEPPGFPEGEVVVDQYAAAQLLFQLLYVRDRFGDLPFILEAFETRDVAALRVYVQNGAPAYDHRYGSGMNRVIACSDGANITDAVQAELRRQAPRSEPWFETAGPRGCEEQIALDVDPTARPLRTDIPVLVATGDADPITPPGDGEAVLEGLAKGQYVEFAAMGHGALFGSEECGEQILSDFLDDPEAKVDTSCASEGAPDFVTDWRRTDAPYQLVAGVREGQRPVGLALAVLLLVAGLFFFPLAALARRIDERRAHVVAPGLARARWASWGGALVSLGGLAWAARMIQQWIADHPLGLPMGVPTGVGLAGGVTLVGVILAAVGTWLAWRRRAAAPTGTLAATLVTFLASFALLGLMTLHGVGPVAL